MAGPDAVRIRHAGVVEVESALEDPDADTKHFAALNSVNILGDVIISQVAVASGSLSQSVEFDRQRSHRILEWLTGYRTILPELPATVRAIAEQQVELTSGEMDKPQPDEPIVNGLLTSLRCFLESAVAAAGAGTGAIALTHLIDSWPS